MIVSFPVVLLELFEAAVKCDTSVNGVEAIILEIAAEMIQMHLIS